MQSLLQRWRGTTLAGVFAALREVSVAPGCRCSPPAGALFDRLSQIAGRVTVFFAEEEDKRFYSTFSSDGLIW